MSCAPTLTLLWEEVSPLGRFRGGRIMSYAPTLTLLWEEVSPWGDLEGVELFINITLPLRRMEWRCLMGRQ